MGEERGIGRRALRLSQSYPLGFTPKKRVAERPNIGENSRLNVQQTIAPKTFGATSTTDEVLEGVDLSGKRVLVTGVSAGLGVETARGLVAQRVCGGGRSEPNKAARRPGRARAGGERRRI